MENSRNFERCDSYEDQLRTLFISCDNSGKETLDEVSLRHLCTKLELDKRQGDILISELLENRSQVSFEVFKEGLVNFLEKTNEGFYEASRDEVSVEEESSRREVEPKFVMKNRAYGRRTRPGSVDLSDEDVFFGGGCC